MIEYLGIISFLGLLIIFLAKLYNLVNLGQFYSSSFVLIGAVLALIFWYIFFASFTSMIGAETVIDSGTTTFTVTDNYYLVYLKMQYLVNILMYVSILFSIFEGALLSHKLVYAGKARKYANSRY